MSSKEKSAYKPAEVCRELDIQPYVLRYWETEFQALAVEGKPKSGQRSYSPQELRTLARIKELLYEEGYTIAGAKKKLEAELESGGPAKSSAPKQAAMAPEAKAPEASKKPPAKKPRAASKTKGKAEATAAPADSTSADSEAGDRSSPPDTASETKEQMRELHEGLAGLLGEARELLERLPR